MPIVANGVTYKKVQVLTEILEETTDESSQVDHMCWLVELEERKSGLLVSAKMQVISQSIELKTTKC